MEKYLEQLIYEMQLCGLSPTSQGNYLWHVKSFLTFCAKPADQVCEEDVRRFLHYLRNEKLLAVGTVNYYHTCLKFFFEAVLENPWNSRRVPKLRGYHTVPIILSTGEVARILQSCDTLKQKAILSTIYASGLRNLEACRLRVQDIHSETMQIFVSLSKRNRERYTILAESNLVLLREYWRECGKPQHWLFPGKKPGQHISTTTTLDYLKKACSKAGITKSVTIHTLRHCFATHFLEAGHTIYDLKPLLGHSSIVSTARYVHLARPDRLNLKSPLDYLVADHGR